MVPIKFAKRAVFRIVIGIKADKGKEGNAPVYTCITANKKRSYIAIKQFVDINYWDITKGALKGTREDFKQINKYLQDVRLTMGDIYQQLMLSGKRVTTQSVKDHFFGNVEEAQTLSSLFEYHNETASSTLKWSTLKHYYVT